MKSLSLVWFGFVSLSAARAEVKGADCLFGISGVAKSEKIECEGSAGQLCGLVKRFTFTLAVNEAKLQANGADLTVVRVGLRNDRAAHTTEFPFEKRNGAFAFYKGEFRVETNNFGRAVNSFEGVFVLEDSKGTIYRLENGSAATFRIDATSKVDLRNFSPNLGCFVNGA